MPKKLNFSIQHYICKIKTPPPAPSFSSIISGCKHPRTTSFSNNRRLRNSDHDERNPSKDNAATLSDIDQFLLDNFRSLYIENGQDDHLLRKIKEEKQEGEAVFESPRFTDTQPHLRGSQRFFVATGLSSSLIEEARLSNMTSTSEEGSRSSSASATKTTSVTVTSRSCHGGRGYDDSKNLNSEYIAVKTYSRSPYHEFRRSMQEMVEAKLEEDGNIDWDFMEELLVCYLNLNEKKSRKFIISAFVDVTVSLRRGSETEGVPARQRRRRTKERRRKSRNVTQENYG